MVAWDTADEATWMQGMWMTGKHRRSSKFAISSVLLNYTLFCGFSAKTAGIPLNTSMPAVKSPTSPWKVLFDPYRQLCVYFPSRPVVDRLRAYAVKWSQPISRVIKALVYSLPFDDDSLDLVVLKIPHSVSSSPEELKKWLAEASEEILKQYS